jgi:hypothetical protein
VSIRTGLLHECEPPGLVEVTISPESSTAMHSVDDGQATSLRPPLLAESIRNTLPQWSEAADADAADTQTTSADSARTLKKYVRRV